ncbi:MAG: hypothetical protein RLZZ524_3104 [Pseudomonadota bacterium]|jgi:hypothetical protein
MAFDAAKFERAKLEPRRATVAVPALAPFFDDGEAPAWQVRGLTSSELHRAMEAGKRQGSIESIVKALAASGDQAQAVRKALGLTADTPGEIAKRLEMLVMGSVAPAIELPAAVKLAEAFPIEFLTLTNEITELTGKGFDLGKAPAASLQTTD